MPISTKNIYSCINESISANTDILQMAQLSGSVYSLEQAAVYSVADLSSLPPAGENEGRIIYIEDIGSYRFSNGFEWINDYNSTLVSNPSGALYSWGSGSYGELGIDGVFGVKIRTDSPVREYYSSSEWCYIAAGGNNSGGIKCDGSMWIWGIGNYGRTGDGDNTYDMRPSREYWSATNWCKLSIGTNHTQAIKSDGSIWGFGHNNCGQIGVNAISPSYFCTPTQEITSSTNWCDVSSGNRCTSLAIKTDGTLWGWGLNTYGMLGTNDVIQQSSPTQEITSSTNWSKVSIDNYETFSLKTDGSFWAWGYNNYGQLLQNNKTNYSSPVQELTSSCWSFVSHSCNSASGIKEDGTLWNWGSNSTGRLANGTSEVTSKSSPIQELTSSTNWCIVCDNPLTVSAIKTDGTLWGWGNNLRGELGTCCAICYSSPVQEYYSYSDWCALSNGLEFRNAILAIKRGFDEP